MKEEAMRFVRSADVTFDVTFADAAGVEAFRAVQSQREVRMTSTEPWPDYVRRGRPIDLEMGLGGAIYRLRGRVRFRRLRTVVVEGTFARESQP